MIVPRPGRPGLSLAPAAALPAPDGRRAGRDRRARRGRRRRAGAGRRPGPADADPALVLRARPARAGPRQPGPAARRRPGARRRQRLADALATLLRHHDALRLRFDRADAGWQQRIAPPDDDPPPFEVFDLSDDPRGRPPGAAIEAEAARAAGGLRPRTRPPAAGGPVRARPGAAGPPAAGRAPPGRRRRLLADPAGRPGEPCSAGSRRGEPPALPPKTTSFRQWAEVLGEVRRLARVGPGVAPTGSRPPAPTPRPCRSTSATAPRPRHRRRVGRAGHRRARRGRDATPCSGRSPRPSTRRSTTPCWRRWPRRFAGWTGRDSVADRPGGPRPRGDHRRRRPVADRRLVHDDLPGPPPPRPGRGPGRRRSGPSRSSSGRPAAGPRLRGAPLPRRPGDRRRPSAGCRAAEVAFNYLGQLDRRLPDRASASPWPAELDRPVAGRRATGGRTCSSSNADVTDGRLHVRWTYNPAVHRPRDDRAAGRGRSSTPSASLVDAGPRRRRSGGYSPSDFPLAGLDQADARPAPRRPAGRRGRLPALADAGGDALPRRLRPRGRRLRPAVDLHPPRRRSTAPAFARGLAAGRRAGIRSSGPRSTGPTPTGRCRSSIGRSPCRWRSTTGGGSPAERSRTRSSTTS